MEAPPRRRDENLFDRKFSLRLGWQGLRVGGLTLLAYYLGFVHLGQTGQEAATANTMAFATLTMSQLFHAFNVRSEHRSLFVQGMFSNPAMNRAFLTGLILQLAVLLIPPLQDVFSVTGMTGGQWLAVLGLAITPIPVCEVEKAIRSRRRKKVGKERRQLTSVA